MALKKMRAKSRKSIVKRIKLTNGGDMKTGKIVINRINDNHRMIKKSRTRTLKAKKNTILTGKAFNKYKKAMK
jgi:ribosomal protein L35